MSTVTFSVDRKRGSAWPPHQLLEGYFVSEYPDPRDGNLFTKPGHCTNNAFLHLCLLAVAGFGNSSGNISGMKLKKLLNLPEIIGLFPLILLQISSHSCEWTNNCQTH